MPNLLAIPTKQESSLAIRDAVRDYIRQNHPDTHPDAFRHDITQWERAQGDATSSVEAATKYQALLAQIANKLPSNIGLRVTYSSAFNPNAPATTHPSLDYARRCTLWNAAALHSQLASAADRSNTDGIRRAVAGYLSAAGILDHLLKLDNGDGLRDDDLTDENVQNVQTVMLAQAQECGWQLAVLENKSNGLIAKISQEVSALYSTVQSPPSNWSGHVQTKAAHFAAAAQYRASMEHNAKHDYGAEVARLDRARAEARRGVTLAKRVTSAVLNDINSLRDMLETAFTRAERDNDLIYHNTVPSFASLPVLKGIRLAQPVVLPEAQAILGQSEPLFAPLIPWGARVAKDVYREKKEAAVREVENAAQELDKEASSALKALGLPSALEALERPAGLPPSILDMARQVRLENAPDRIARKQEAIETVKDADRAEMESIWDLLDSEEGPPAELVEHAKTYESHLDTAAASDVQVAAKWDAALPAVEILMWDEAALAATVPAATGPGQHSPESRALRTALNQLEAYRERIQGVAQQARTTAAKDDIGPKVQRLVQTLGRWDRAPPAVFGEIIDESVSRYDDMLDGVHALRDGLLERIDVVTAKDEEWRNSRKGASAVRDRERKLRELEEAHSKYVEVNGNLDEGIKFYNDLAERLARLKDHCAAWIYDKQEAARSNTKTQRKKEKAPAVEPANAQPQPQPQPQPQSTKRGIALPPPDSEEWVDFSQLKLKS